VSYVPGSLKAPSMGSSSRGILAALRPGP